MVFRQSRLWSTMLVSIGFSVAFASSPALAKKDKDKGEHGKKEHKYDGNKKANKDWDSYKSKKEGHCSDAEMAKYHKAATFKTNALGKIALGATLGIITWPLGYAPQELIELGMELVANGKYPDCAKRVNKEEAEKLKKNLEENARKHGPKEFDKDPCGTPVKAWIGLLKALEKTHAWKRIPHTLQAGAYVLVGSTVPIVCTTGVAIFALKKVFLPLLENELVPKILDFLLEKVANTKMGGKIMGILEKVMGAADKVMGFANHVAAMGEAIASKSKDTFDKAKKALDGLTSGWLEMTPAKFVEILRALLKEGLDALADLGVDKLTGLLWKVVGKAVGAIEKAVLTALGSIPFAGGVLVGLIGVVIEAGVDMLLVLLADEGKKMVHKGIAKLVDAICDGLAKQAKSLNPPKGLKSFQKIFSTIADVMAKVMKTAGQVREKVGAVSTQMQKAFNAATATMKAR